MPTRAGLLLALLLPLLTQAKPLELPEDLLPRPTLEKIYTAELPNYNPADYQKLYDAHILLEKYFLTDSAEDRKAITQILEKSDIPAATLGRMCRINLVWPVLPPGPAYVNERIGPHDVQYFLGIPKDYDRAKPFPLVIKLASAQSIIPDPANPPKADEVVQLYTKWITEELAAHPDAVVIMPLLNLDELYGPSYKGMNTVIQAMHHVTTRVNIDQKQIYMLGHGMSAHATWNLALHYPTYFAAINPQAGAASGDWQRVRVMNLKNTLPVVWHDQSDTIIKFDQSTAIVNILKSLKYDVVFEITKTAGHNIPPDIAEKCYKTMRARTRDLYPQQVNLRSTRPDPTFNRIDWLQVYQPLNSGPERSLTLRHGTGKIIVNENAFSINAAFTTPNKIEAKSDNVQTLQFHFNDQMVDLSKPVTIVVNNKTRFEGMLKVSIDEMLKDQLFIGRGARYFTAAVDVELVTIKPATKPTTTPTTQATQFFFTTDEGKTLFADSATLKPPFQHEGKVAYRAHVYSIDNGKTTFVAYLSKWSPIANESLLRKPGEQTWLLQSSPGGINLTNAKPLESQPTKTPMEQFPKEKGPEKNEQQ